MNFPKKFVHNVLLACPDKGQAFLDEIPNLIAYCEERWSLKIHEPFELSYNFVAPATLTSGEEVVVKLSLPEEGYDDERKALLSLNPNGRVQVIDEDVSRRILLLEKVQPGTPLSDLEQDHSSTRIAAKLVRQLVTKDTGDVTLPTTKSRENQLRKIYANHPDGIGPISEGTLQEAIAVFDFLNETLQSRYILHGDFHHYNILKRRDKDWLAIDPKGLVGEVEYDLIQFLLNRLPAQKRKQCIEDRIKIFMEELNLNKERLLLWGFCHTVLAASWTVDPVSNHYDKTFLSGVEIFRSLYKSTYNRDIGKGIF
ncbi:hydroxyurea phosphotransferase [Halobacillus andaensis]|uniref:Hydroxyurea phosphotransferase n=1 Tax=Halobacillus andaensis TaxID=1176239 RepID=A0A917B6I9_HALAA|nr:aminoglycoside phosphotransferase family protein [Halobacillus andaensis]MBP2005833.1 streptomycin 6-kinase [Halobacillus andaensis]GGF25733.1 hydroxyurea phosphotransferase [Halobacillus andaensis]